MGGEEQHVAHGDARLQDMQRAAEIAEAGSDLECERQTERHNAEIGGLQ